MSFDASTATGSLPQTMNMPEADRSGLVLALLTAILQHRGSAGPSGPPAQAPIPLSHAD
ncbi:hypothetical protein PTTG_27707 [Puccinia triticina 1-1 BBBD Race 1]|uniref:Uncharacterized protein n=1 Tax=Puccinia triticina (isolate 1-1 / race 1 (BBBD)) TaxID=630390 RepID=A0A180GHJ9_PUCT1|nr:hypothetical protein PTTG_27707 [Puccinia triticina 1-1 BBBD Race 1]